MRKLLLSGNEAIALGAYRAGATVGTAYPGTPSTETIQEFSKYPSVYTEWSTNEKVALEVAIGASLSGARTLVTMKHVGLNVAADPLFTQSYIGVKGGLVILVADDPAMHSSQNEQDSRHYAIAAKIPMLEPADSQEAFEFTRLAFDISEEYDTPVFIRSTTRISHSKSIVNDDEKNKAVKTPEAFERDPKKFVMIPAYARARHIVVEQREKNLKDAAEKISINTTEINNKDIGFITSGISYNYIKENFNEASIMKLGMVNPIPTESIKDFAKQVKELYIAEELDPIFETQIKSYGIKCYGKDKLPILGEFTPDTIKEAVLGIKKDSEIKTNKTIPARPPSLCEGCPHRPVFKVLKELNLIVSGDIGCYTLGSLPPFSAMDICVDMGASINVAQGIEIGLGKNYKNNAVAVIGDSTFAHSGLTGLVNAAYNKRHSLIIVLDNGTTAMTGMQPNPFSGKTIKGEDTSAINYEKLAEAVGIGKENFMIVDCYKEKNLDGIIKTLLNSNKLSLLIVKGVCIINKRKMSKQS